jgi:hypothetical protein
MVGGADPGRRSSPAGGVRQFGCPFDERVDAGLDRDERANVAEWLRRLDDDDHDA